MVIPFCVYVNVSSAIMKKRIYIKPEVEVLSIEVERGFVSSDINVSVDIDSWDDGGFLGEHEL